MAIARDAFSNGNNTGTSLTVSHTVAAGSNRYLIVGIYGTGAVDLVSGVTWNGVAMTRLIGQGYNSGTTHNVYLYGLANPDTGTHDVVVSSSLSQDVYCGVLSLTGVSQTDPTGNALKGFTSTAASAATMNPVSIVDASWAVTFVRNLDGSFNNGTNFTILGATGWGSIEMGDSNGDMGSAGTETVEPTTGGNTRWNTVTAALAPYVATGLGGIMTAKRGTWGG